MAPDGGPFYNAFWWIGELAFKWIPGTVINIAEGGAWPSVALVQQGGANDGSGVAYLPVDHPVSPLEVAHFLQTSSAPGAYEVLFHRWSVFVAISLFVSLLLGALIIYCAIRIFQVRQMERRRFATMQRTVTASDVPKTQLRWQRVLEQAQSDDPQSWRLAILEADIMLNELLDMQGYKGETMADKMKTVERADFHSIDAAWEAHKMRNRIAHEGANLSLNARDVLKIIGLYGRVLKEFKMIE